MRSPLRTVDGRYDLIRVLGEGGVGVVWLARDRKRRQNVALKIIDGKASSADPRREFDILQRLQASHREGERQQNVITVYDFNWSSTPDGERFAYYTMEYLDGDLIGRYRWTDDEELFYVCIQCLRTLARFHQAGILHGDIKSLNIMVCRIVKDLAFGAPTTWRDTPPSVKFLDFGFALELRGLDSIALDGKLLEGKPGTSFPWAPPELVRAERERRRAMLTERSDIYSLGAVFYELASGGGRRAFPQSSSEHMMRNKLDPTYAPAALDGVPRKVSELIHAMMAFSPSARPRAAEAAESLQQAMPHLTVETSERRLGEIRGMVEFVDVEGAAEQVASELSIAMGSNTSNNTFLLDGDEGIGKSRLLRELPRLLHGHNFKVVAFSARQPLDRLAGTLSDALEVPNHAHQFQMLHPPKARSTTGRLERDLRSMLSDFMRLEGRPVVLALDDGHFMDRDVSSLVASVAKDLQGRRILFVVAGRFEGRPPDGFDDPRAIQWRPLSERGVERLLGLKLRSSVSHDLIAEIYKRHHGNPGKSGDALRLLFAEDRVARQAGGPYALKEGPLAADPRSPRTPAERLTARQRMLLGLLEAVPSYMGVRADDLASVCRMDPDVTRGELRKLERLDLLEHDVVNHYPKRATPVIRGTSLVTRKESQRIARLSVVLCESLEERETDDAARLDLAHERAEHLAAAGRGPEAVQLALAHAPKYHEAGFSKKALDLYLVAVRVYEGTKKQLQVAQHREWQTALLGAALCEKNADKEHESTAYFQQAAEHAKKQLSVADHVRALVRFVEAYPPRAGKELDEALKLLPSVGDSERVKLEVLAAHASRLGGNEQTRREGLRVYEDLFSRYQSIGESPPLELQIARGYIRSLGSPDDPPGERVHIVERGWKEIAQALEVAEATGDKRAALAANEHLHYISQNYDRWHDARVHALKALDLSKKLDDRAAERKTRQFLISYLGFSGTADVIRREAEEFLTTSHPEATPTLRVRMELIALSRLDGNFAEALDAAMHIRETAERLAVELPSSQARRAADLKYLGWNVRRFEARCLSEMGLHEEALVLLDGVRRSVEATQIRGGRQWELLENDIAEGEIHLAMMRRARRQQATSDGIPPDELVGRLSRAVEQAEKLLQRMYGGLLKAMLVEARSLADDPTPPDSLTARAVSEIQPLGAPIWEARVRRHLAEAYRECNPSEALVHATQGLAERELKSNGLQWQLHALAGAVRLAQGDRPGAEEHYHQALRHTLKIQGYLDAHRRATGISRYQAAFLLSSVHVLDRIEELQGTGK